MMTSCVRTKRQLNSSSRGTKIKKTMSKKDALLDWIAAASCWLGLLEHGSQVGRTRPPKQDAYTCSICKEKHSRYTIIQCSRCAVYACIRAPCSIECMIFSPEILCRKVLHQLHPCAWLYRISDAGRTQNNSAEKSSQDPGRSA